MTDSHYRPQFDAAMQEFDRVADDRPARDMTPTEIANVVLRTYGAARRDAANQVAELLEPLHDGRLPDKLTWRREFDPAPPEDTGAAKPKARDDDDFGQKSYLRKTRR